MELGSAPFVFGTVATTIFVGSYLPMLARAVRTHDLSSYSRSSLVLANVGNLAQTVYVLALPVGPIWGLHTFYLLATLMMLVLHLRHVRSEPFLHRSRQRVASPSPGSSPRTADTTHVGPHRTSREVGPT